MAYIGSAPTSVVSRDSAKVYRYTATAGQTVFSGADADNQILNVTPSDTRVHLNGLLLEPSDYNLTNSSVTLTTAASAGDELTVTGFQTFEVADTYTKATSDARYVNTTGDTISGNLIVDGSVALNPSSGVTVTRGSSHSNNFEGGRVTLKNGSGYTKQYGLDTYYENFRIFRENEDGTGGVVRFEIDAEGRVTMPYQPAFSAYNLATASQYAVTGDTWSTFDSNLTNWNTTKWYADTNVGSGFSTSNGRFTAPVAGKYRLNLHVSYYVQNTAYVVIYKNGTYQAPYALAYTTPSASYQSLSVSSIIPLSAGDYVEAGGYMRSNQTYIPGGGYINFSGHLIG